MPLLSLLAASASVALAPSATTATPPLPATTTRPHVVFILADDAGIADVARYHEHFMGSPARVPTPHLDRLCREGMMFTDAHLPASLCAPTRFSLITGSYPHRSRTTGTWNRTASSAFHFGETENARIDNPHRTLGGALQSAGYRTGYFGKMHFGGDFYDRDGNLLRMLRADQLHQIDFSRKFDNGLLDHGFDYTFVSPDGIQGPVYLWFENDRYLPVSELAAHVEGIDPNPPSVLRAFAQGDTVGRGEMITDGWGDSRFDTSEHGPILGHFATRFIEDHVANHPDQPFLVYYATPAIHTPLTPEPDLLGASGLDLRADFVMDLDRQVGRLLKTLDRLQIADRTLVIFTSDNGGAHYGGDRMIAAGQPPNGPFRGNKGTVYEGGQRVSFIWKWGDGTPAGSTIPPDTVCSQLVSVLDWVPSILHIVGGTLAEDQHMDATTLLPLLTSPTPDALPPVRRWHLHRGDVVDPRNAVRMDDEAGKWVFIHPTARRPMELYDLATDLSQQKNLLEGFNAPQALPNNHPQRPRVLAMAQWFATHSRANSPRTMPALDFQREAPAHTR